MKVNFSIEEGEALKIASPVLDLSELETAEGYEFS